MHETNGPVADKGLLLDVLSERAGDGRFVELYRDLVSSERIEGRVLCASEHVVLLAQVGESLSFDGVTAIRTREISRVVTHSTTEQISGTVGSWRLDDIGLLELTAALTRLEQAFGHVALHLEGCGVVYVGRTISLDDDFANIECVAPGRAAMPYQVLLRHEELTRLEAGTEYLRNLLRQGDTAVGSFASRSTDSRAT